MSVSNVIVLPFDGTLVLDAFDAPVTFHRCLVPITGSVTAALMLSRAIWASQEDVPSQDGWFARTAEQWTEETGLSRWEQQTARRALRAGGFMEERRVGMPPRLCFRVRPERILVALRRHARASAQARVPA